MAIRNAGLRVSRGGKMKSAFSLPLAAILAAILATGLFVSCGGSLGVGTGIDEGVKSATLGTLARVPAGSFQRDATYGNVSEVSAFLMSSREITWDQYEQVMSLVGDIARDYSDGYGDSPAEYVNWYMAIAFCNKLSIAEGLTPVYGVLGVDFRALSYWDIPYNYDTHQLHPEWDSATFDRTANGYRLPTEAEWMWAAMGADKDAPGQVNRSGYLKAFAGDDGSNSIGDYAVFGFQHGGQGSATFEGSVRTASKKPNELGIYDMSGNVSEWCYDWYLASFEYLQGSLAAGYSGPSVDRSTYPSAPQRCIRGGTWFQDALFSSVANRDSFQSPYEQGIGHTIGFRVVRN
jgi:formylglycine-generating enzyme required for sulfatase activity